MREQPQPTPRIPTGAIVALALVAAIIIVALGVVLRSWWYDLTIWHPQLAGTITVITIVALALCGVAMVAAAAARLWLGVVVHERRNRHDVIKREHVIELKRAEVQTAPHATSFHQHVETHSALAAPPHQLLLPESASAPALSIPSFAQLLDSGKIGPNRPLILGYDADSGQPIEGTWERLYSCGVGGMTGSGKSWVIAFLAGQSVAAGARIVLIDPHAGDDASLSSRLAGLSPSFMCDVASTPSAIESALKLASSKLENRRNGKGGNWPILLIADEWTSMLRGTMGDLLTATALDYAEQGRKYGCFALLGAQAWQVDAAGAVRDRLASHYVLRTRGDQFRYQTGLRAGGIPDDTLTLPPGQAYLLSTRGALAKVQIPTMTHADILRLGTLVDRPAAVVNTGFGFVAPTQALTPITASAVTSRRHDGDIKVTSANHVTTAAERGKAHLSPDAVRAVELFYAGTDLPAIVKEIRGVAPKEGRKYMTALSEVTDLLRQATRGVQS